MSGFTGFAWTEGRVVLKNMQFKQYPDSSWRGISNSVLLLLFTANWRFLPSDFSFWVAANMPLDDNLRLQILSINCPTQRLRRELEIVRKVSEGYDWFAHWKFSGSSQSYRFLGGGAGKNIRRPGWLGRSELSMRLRRARTWWTRVPITFPRT